MNDETKGTAEVERLRLAAWSAAGLYGGAIGLPALEGIEAAGLAMKAVEQAADRYRSRLRGAAWRDGRTKRAAEAEAKAYRRRGLAGGR